MHAATALALRCGIFYATVLRLLAVRCVALHYRMVEIGLESAEDYNRAA